MQKTTNYNLNKPEVTDPLRLADFNENADIMDAALGQLWNGLLQMGERHLKQKYAAMDETALTQEDNLLLNPLTSAEMAQTLTGAEWDAEQKVHIGRTPEVNRTYLRAYIGGYTNGSIKASSYRTSTATYDFTAPKNAVITDFDLRYFVFFSSTDSTLTNVSLTFRAAKKNGSSYTAFYEKSGLTLDLSGTEYVTGYFTVPVGVPLEQGAEYRLSLTLDSGYGCLGQFGFTTTTEDDDSQFTVNITPVTTGAHRRALTTHGTLARALVLMEYQQEEDTGGITVTMNGAELKESERSTVQGDGTVTHTVVCTGAVPESAEHTLSFDLHCSENDKLSLNKYGVYLM